MPEHRWYNAGFQKARVEWKMEKKTSSAKNTEWEMCFLLFTLYGSPNRHHDPWRLQRRGVFQCPAGLLLWSSDFPLAPEDRSFSDSLGAKFSALQRNIPEFTRIDEDEADCREVLTQRDKQSRAAAKIDCDAFFSSTVPKSVEGLLRSGNS
jgi:hypothetical protein